MYNTPHIEIPTETPIEGLLAHYIANAKVPVCLECSEKMDSEHYRKHSIFILARRDAEENA